MKHHSAAHHPFADNILIHLEEEARAVALAFGVPTANALAAALIDRVRGSVGGARVYLPKRDARRRVERDAAIRAQFNGRNTDELARQHGIHVRTVRRIVGQKNSDMFG